MKIISLIIALMLICHSAKAMNIEYDENYGLPGGIVSTATPPAAGVKTDLKFSIPNIGDGWINSYGQNYGKIQPRFIGSLVGMVVCFGAWLAALATSVWSGIAIYEGSTGKKSGIEILKATPRLGKVRALGRAPRMGGFNFRGVTFKNMRIR
jgi:hypothetical protein